MSQLELQAHEIIGEAVVGGSETAIQVSNLIRKIEGKETFRTGDDHEDGPFSKEKINKIPEKLKKNK